MLSLICGDPGRIFAGRVDFRQKKAPDQAERAVSFGGGAQTPRKKARVSSARAVHNAGMTPGYDFKLALTRVIEPTGGAISPEALRSSRRRRQSWTIFEMHGDLGGVRMAQDENLAALGKLAEA